MKVTINDVGYCHGYGEDDQEDRTPNLSRLIGKTFPSIEAARRAARLASIKDGRSAKAAIEVIEHGVSCWY